MKISKVLHAGTVLTGFIGLVTFAATMIGGADNSVFGVTKFDSLMCTAILFLIAIWLQIAAIHHMKLEDKGERI